MASAEMPLMLDAAMDVDMDVNVDNPLNGMDPRMPANFDLFGDPLRPATASKQLLQRLDELRTRGCCQGIAWSRQGTIASVSKDGRSIDLRFLRCHPETGVWDLSDPTPCSVFSNPVPGSPVTHLAWAATSSPELAVVDSAGRVTILSFSITLNRPYFIRRWDTDLADDLHAVVGCYWLPLASQGRQYHIMYGPAVREASNYKYETSIVPAFGPWHPNPTKSALLCVTTNGLLKVFFSQNNSKIEERSLDLESAASSDDLITHASLCSDRQSLIIALATSSKQLKVIRATIQWGYPPSDKQVPPGALHLNPSLKAKRIAITSWFQPSQAQSHLDSSMTQLSHIEVLPSALEGPPSNSNQSLAPPIVLTVRSYATAEHSSYNQDQQSIVDRWEILNEQPQSINPAFEQLRSKAGQAPNPPTMARLRKLDSIVIPKIIISVHLIQLGTIVAFAFSDGTIQHRDRLTMNEVFNEINTNRIMTLSQVGFQFAEETPCLQVALSPTGSSLVQICEDSKIKWNSMKYGADGTPPPVQNNNQHSAIIAALSVATSCAAIQQMNYDDILAIARPFSTNNRFLCDWIMEIVRMLKVAVDYSEEAHHDQLVRNNNLQLCLSILNHLGFRGETQPRSFGGKFAMLALNVRNAVILITIANNTPMAMREKLNPLDEPEVVDALAGCAKWALDLLAWLSDCLFNLLEDDKFMAILRNNKRFFEMTSYLQSQNDVALHLLLCSSTRGFLSAACRRLLHLDSLSSRAIEYYEKKAALQNTATADQPGGSSTRTLPVLQHAYQKMQSFTSSSLVKVSEFDKLLSTLSQEIRSAYQNSLPGLSTQGRQQGQQQGNGVGAGGAGGAGAQGGGVIDPVKRAQNHCELSMLLAGSPPPSFQEVLVNFFDNRLRAFKAQSDPAQLFFADYALLEVEDDRRSLVAKKATGRYVDVFRRSELAVDSPAENGADTQWRRCVRCASVMENVHCVRPGFTFVLGQQRKCSCGGNWGMLPKGSLVS